MNIKTCAYRHRRLLTILAGVVMVTTAFLVRWHSVSEHYQETLGRYRILLAELQTAERNHAGRFARTTFHESHALLDSAQSELDRQTAGWLIFRDYARADSFLTRSVTQVRKAGQEARQAARSFQEETRRRRDQLASRIVALRESMDTSLFRLEWHRLLEVADDRLRLASDLIDDEHLTAAGKSLDSCTAVVSRLEDRLHSHRSDEVAKQEVWDQWVAHTLEESRTKGINAIVVDKSAHRLLLFSRGTISASFACDLGYNPAVQKTRSGDGATPEGMYRVTRIRPSGSKYYKALMLNFPNQQDRARFHDNQKKDVIPAEAGIGGLIEIHGDGGQGKDWTDGCVALSNQDMDKLMKLVEVGTPVTIVRRSGLVR